METPGKKKLTLYNVHCITNLNYHTKTFVNLNTFKQENGLQNRRISFIQINICDVYQYICINGKRIIHNSLSPSFLSGSSVVG